MSIKLSTYIGPFLECEWGDIDEWKWGHLICNGRMEAREEGERMMMVPNQKIEGIDRGLWVDAHGEHGIHRIEPATIVKEKAAFGRMVAHILSDLERANAWHRLSWGVVPRFA